MSTYKNSTQTTLFDEVNPMEELTYLEAQANQVAESNQYEIGYAIYEKVESDEVNNFSVTQGKVVEFPEITREELAGFTPCTSPAGSIPGPFTAMVIGKNSDRITFSDEVMQSLQYPEGLVFSLGHNKVAVGTGIPGNCNYFKVHYSGGGRYSIYSKSLGREIRNHFGLFPIEIPYAFLNKRFVKFDEEMMCLIDVPNKPVMNGEQKNQEIDEL